MEILVFLPVVHVTSACVVCIKLFDAGSGVGLGILAFGPVNHITLRPPKQCLTITCIYSDHIPEWKYILVLGVTLQLPCSDYGDTNKCPLNREGVVSGGGHSCGILCQFVSVMF